MNESFYISEYEKLRRLIGKCLNKGDFNKAITLIAVCAELQYQWNQVYSDPFLEECLTNLVTINGLADYKADHSMILFYDSFGLDTRGLAINYLKALAGIGYNVVYLTINTAKNKQPEIDKIIENSCITKVYYSNTPDRKSAFDEIINVFETYKPDKAFFYSLPNDSVGALAFMSLPKDVVRYQINLTDHAFWLGLKAIDYCIEFRSYGAAISAECRNIDKSSIIMLPFYPNINKDQSFLGFQFDTDKKKIMFSGGALYKTFDKDLTYYRMVRRILDTNPELVFVYAGAGDTSEIDKLVQEYKGRVHLINERKDLFALMKHITLYLSTYPITGGLMTQYAASAGKIPITLKFDSISDGFLIEQNKRKIEYDTVDSVVEDVTKLLNDYRYLMEREKMLDGSLSNDEEFMDQLNSVITNNTTKYSIDFTMPNVAKLQSTYRDNFTEKKYGNAVARYTNLSCISIFWKYYVNKLIPKLVERIKK